MTLFARYQLYFLSALALSCIMIGCRSRSEFVGETLPDTPVRTVSESEKSAKNVATNESPPANDISSKAPKESAAFGWDNPAEASEPVSVNKPEAAEALLAASGAVLEHDQQGRAVGADLTEARFSASVARSLAELTDLQWIDLRGARVTDADLAIVATLPRLQLLALGDTKVTDAGLRHLIHQQDLRFLSLDRTAVTDAGLAALAGLPKLEGISLLGTQVSRVAAAAFETKTPGCRTILDDTAPAAPPTERRQPAAVEPVPGEPTTQADEVWNIESLDPEPTAPVVVPRQKSGTAPPQGLSRTKQTLGQVLQRKLLDPDVLRALGQHLMAQQEYAKAVRAYEALAALEPDNEQARFDLGIALARTGQYEDALRVLSGVVGEATALYNLGVIAFEEKQQSRSEWYFSRAVEIAPDFADARKWLNYIRQAAIVTPASHIPEQIDRRDLVDLLMSELDALEDSTPRGTASAGIEIVPANRSADR